MELAYVCEWDKRSKSTHCPSIPLVCSWSCRNLVAFTTDLKNNNEDKGKFIFLSILRKYCKCPYYYLCTAAMPSVHTALRTRAKV